MKAVTVIGGGFSGLATAYYLSSAGIPVEIVEKTGRLGGLIATLQTPHGPVETAAIAMRNSARVDALCRDLGLGMISSSTSFSRARSIYRQRPTRWPLSPGESLALLARYATAAVRGSREPRPLETVEQWGARVLGRRATRWLVGPTLQGTYAGDPERLSASLVFGRRDRPTPSARKGAVAPARGMQQLIDALENRLRTAGVSIRLNGGARLDGATPVVICTAARDAAEILRDVSPAASQALSTIDMLPLVRITAFYPEGETPKGRGILFPRGGDIRALGVLFNTNVFPQREGRYSESWIYGGATDRGVVDLSETNLQAVMDRDRQLLYGRGVRPDARFIHCWRQALPYYDLQLESMRARSFDLPPGVFLAGNYVAGIGLSMLLEQAATVATRVRADGVKREGPGLTVCEEEARCSVTPILRVLVVGAGPVGLVAALFLRQHGVRVEIVDMHLRTAKHSYALAIHPRTLQILDEAGLSDGLISAGRKVTKVAYYDQGERRAEIDYSALASSHPYLLVVRQSLLERAAEEALRRQKLNVLWEHRLQSLSVDGASLQAEVARLDQVAMGYPVARSESVVVGTDTIRPGYVIGADGYDSAVRRMAGIEMEAQGPGQVFSVYETEAAGDLPADVRVMLDPELTSVYWPLEEGRCRWGFQIRDASEHAASMERLEQLIAARAPWCRARPTQIYWSTLALFEARLARSLGRGGVWLAGDAAHQAAPVGVHSMNSGLVEARELAARMARILRAGGAASLLEEFATETHDAWRGLLGAGSGVRALVGADPWVRENAARIVACMPASGDDLEPLLEQIGLSDARS